MTTFRTHFARGFGAIGAGLLLSPSLPAAESAGLYDHATMVEHDLKGLRVWLGRPVQVTSQIGWGMDWVHPGWQPAWSFIHLTPYMAKFPDGNLIATYTMDPDTQENPFFLSAYNISADNGAHWGRRYATLIQHIRMVFLPGEPDSLMAIASELMLKKQGDTQNLVGPYWLFKHGGAEVTMVQDGVRLVDWPWPNRRDPEAEGAQSPQPWDNQHVEPYISGSAIRSGHKWIATAFGRKGDAAVDSSMLISSEDGGKTWRYYATIADGDPAHKDDDRYEGANESSFIRLADGELMAVFRRGSGTQWPIGRAYSHDEGETWSKADLLPAWSVEPHLIRAANGTIALATGRPQIYVWFSTDLRAASWESVNIVDHHNAMISDPSAHIASFRRPAGHHRPEYDSWQTTAYTSLVETSPNHLLLVYDRDAERKPENEKDVSRVYVLPIEIERR